jgi:hypothetical protein
MITGGTADVKVYGNIMSLVDETGFAKATAIPESMQVFSGLFTGNDHLTDASGLQLPATTLRYMCYAQMFSGCTNLTTAPALPATTLASSCYSMMFEGCTKLTTAPDLKAETLVDYCYDRMFKGCTNLNAVTCLATGIGAENCTTNWLDGVSTTGTFTKASSMTTWTTGANGIPSGWTVTP